MDNGQNRKGNGMTYKLERRYRLGGGNWSAWGPVNVPAFATKAEAEARADVYRSLGGCIRVVVA